MLNIKEVKERIEILENNENTEEYDEMLDEVGIMLDEVGIDTSIYSASMILKNIDEIAYRCGFDDYNDEELSNFISELEDLEEELKKEQLLFLIIKFGGFKMEYKKALEIFEDGNWTEEESALFYYNWFGEDYLFDFMKEGREENKEGFIYLIKEIKK